MRVLLGMQGAFVILAGAFIGFLQFGFAFWGASDSQDVGQLWSGLAIGIGLLLAGIAVGGGAFALTFVRSRWSPVVIASIESLLILFVVVGERTLPSMLLGGGVCLGIVLLIATERARAYFGAPLVDAGSAGG